MNIKIDKTIKNILPDFSILAFKMDVNYNEEDALEIGRASCRERV